MTSTLVAAADKNAPENSLLYTVLRKASGGGTMPKTPACAFSASDMQRIADWIGAGAADD